MIKFTMRGSKEMAAKIRKIARNYPTKIGRALYTEMSIEATEMKRRTPVDTREEAPHPGQLRNSIHVEPPEYHGKMISVTVATGAEAPYDIYVHENLDSFHEVGQAKFMESVLNESQPYIGERIARRARIDEEE